ncbi:MAG: tRNA 2-thiouridine(34) synthase MnmA [Armatimonadetes bacterium]|nr:tRNA 2-thiouridine(34) synthase MnmA [Armatimonadota bacterium]
MDRVAVAMSGGVDSAVAAALTIGQGHEAIGLTAKLLPTGWGAARGCCDVDVAREVCRRLGIEYHVVDLSADFLRHVVEYFVATYASGLTPNPCVPCNRLVKFGSLLEAAAALGCRVLVTGHYVRRQRRDSRWGLRRACDLSKDQSYMLLSLSQQQLRRASFPLAELRKQQVIEEARRRGLPVLLRESQDLCFVSSDYRDFLAERITVQPGPILDTEGRKLGQHQGLPFYTVGQRRGLRIGGGRKLYVLAHDVKRNALIVGTAEQLCRREFEVVDVNWVSIPQPEPGTALACRIMVRYRGRFLSGEVTVLAGHRCRVSAEPHTQAIAPGQYAAFYDDEGWLLGGGRIALPPVP